MSIPDYVAILAAAIGICGVMITAYIALNFGDLKAKVKDLEREQRDDKRQFAGLQIISRIILQSVNESYAVADIQRRQIEDLISSVNSITSASAFSEDFRLNDAKFVEALATKMDAFPRLVLFARLLSLNSTDLPDTLEDLVAKFPDEETLAFLDALLGLYRDGEIPLVRTITQRLRWQLHPPDASAWTGMKS